MSLTPLSFSGISKFSEDFQSIIDRAVAIASLPVQQMQYEQADTLQRRVLVSGLSTAVGGLATSMKNLGTVGEQKALSASSSNTAKVTATNVSLASAATYTISEVTSVAATASETSLIV